jgi:hypothetical protein
MLRSSVEMDGRWSQSVISSTQSQWTITAQLGF